MGFGVTVVFEKERDLVPGFDPFAVAVGAHEIAASLGGMFLRPPLLQLTVPLNASLAVQFAEEPVDADQVRESLTVANRQRAFC